MLCRETTHIKFMVAGGRNYFIISTNNLEYSEANVSQKLHNRRVCCIKSLQLITSNSDCNHKSC